MSKILCVCNEGNNRSVTVAHQLKYLGHDCIPVGLSTNSQSTLELLCEWADHIIVTDSEQQVPPQHQSKVRLWDIGPDVFPRPFNKTLLAVVRGREARERDSLGEELAA